MTYRLDETVREALLNRENEIAFAEAELNNLRTTATLEAAKALRELGAPLTLSRVCLLCGELRGKDIPKCLTCKDSISR